MSDRLVRLDGCFNLRDLGGFVTSPGGRRVRRGMVFRSDALHELTANDVEVVRSLGLRAIYDLRRGHERDAFPTVADALGGVHDIHLDLFDDPAAPPGPDWIELAARGELEVFTVERRIESYIRTLTVAAPTFGRLLTSLTEDGALPALFHCAAGKDRTGIAAALLLGVLGVDRDEIVADYAATNDCRTERFLAERVGERVADHTILRICITAHPETMVGTLDWLDATHGGVEGYLTGPAGMAPVTLERLRSLLLEP